MYMQIYVAAKEAPELNHMLFDQGRIHVELPRGNRDMAPGHGPSQKD